MAPASLVNFMVARLISIVDLILSYHQVRQSSNVCECVTKAAYQGCSDYNGLFDGVSSSADGQVVLSEK